MNEIVLSICIPTFNRETELMRQVSFLNDELKEVNVKIEFLISDNNPSSSLQYQNLDIFKNFHININKSNLGLIGNLKILTNLAKGRYIWFVGDDDILVPGILKKVLQVISLNPNSIFINHALINRNIITIERILSSNTETISVFELYKKTYGALMFITANIVKKENLEILFEFEKTLQYYDEYSNLALPILFQFINNQYSKVHVINEVLIFDQISGVSWSSQSSYVWSIGISKALISLRNFRYNKHQVKKLIFLQKSLLIHVFLLIKKKKSLSPFFWYFFRYPISFTLLIIKTIYIRIFNMKLN